jgi:autophagy-related protein 16-1
MGCASGVFSLDIATSDAVTCSGHRDGSIKFWSIKEGKIMHEIKAVHEASISSCQYMPGNANQVITSSRDQTVKVVDVRNYKVVQTLSNENWSSYCDNSLIGVSPQGKYVALPSSNGKLIILNRDSNKVETIFDKEHKSNAIVSVDWSMRTSKVASIDTKGTIVIWS